ncbi:MAG: site-2 protease family protein, partial [Patescibacteria group bacterium]|nr:site-2 protease family protein [Patescibacteria group bacterium]
TGQTVKYGLDAVLSLIALLSLNLAIMNVLPIPALDGGRLFFILLEAVTGIKVSPKVENYTHAVGMAVLMFFILLITFHDLFRVFSGQSLLPK